MSASRALQDVVLATLLGDAAVSAAVGGRVYDGPPEGVVYPYISFGPASFRPQRFQCVSSKEEVLQIDVWTAGNGRGWPCKDIVEAVVSAVDDAGLSLPDPYAVSRCDVEIARVVPDPEPQVWHGIVQLVAEIETQA